MNRYRICVYAICKNEAAFVDRWMDSMEEADEIVVLDTGSTDDTVERLRARGAQVTAEGVQLDHHPDSTKSRGQYLPLLELSVQEAPEDDRNMHYLGREYLYHGHWDDCIRTLQRHLAMPSAVWADERAASMRYIARALENKGEASAARNWLLRAIAEAPHLREPYTDLAMLLYRQSDWPGVLYFTGCALEIKERPRSYICEAASWGSLPHDLRAIAWYQLGHLEEALTEAQAALSLSPTDTRLQGDVKAIEEALKKRSAQ